MIRAMQGARALFARAVYPLVIALGVLVAVALPGRLAVPLEAAVALAVVVMAAVVVLAERLQPFRESWLRSHGDFVSDVLHTAVALAITQALLVAAAGAASQLPWSRAPWPETWPLTAQLVLLLLVVDLLGYLLHRAMHAVDFLWRIHAVHHGAERLYWLNAFRLHPLDAGASTVVCLLWTVWFDVPAEVFALHAVVSTGHLLVQHSNIEAGLHRWRWLLATPEFHRVHHHPDQHQGRAHYGHVLSVWDHLLGSARPPGGPTLAVGPSTAMPRGYFRLLLVPFGPQASPNPHPATADDPAP